MAPPVRPVPVDDATALQRALEARLAARKQLPPALSPEPWRANDLMTPADLPKPPTDAERLSRALAERMTALHPDEFPLFLPPLSTKPQEYPDREAADALPAAPQHPGYRLQPPPTLAAGPPISQIRPEDRAENVIARGQARTILPGGDLASYAERAAGRFLAMTPSVEEMTGGKWRGIVNIGDIGRGLAQAGERGQMEESYGRAVPLPGMSILGKPVGAPPMWAAALPADLLNLALELEAGSKLPVIGGGISQPIRGAIETGTGQIVAPTLRSAAERIATSTGREAARFGTLEAVKGAGEQLPPEDIAKQAVTGAGGGALFGGGIQAAKEALAQAVFRYISRRQLLGMAKQPRIAPPTEPLADTGAQPRPDMMAPEAPAAPQPRPPTPPPTAPPAPVEGSRPVAAAPVTPAPPVAPAAVPGAPAPPAPGPEISQKRETGQPGDVVQFPVAQIGADPDRLQYKQLGSEGISGELRGVEKVNRDLLGVLAVWRDPATGEVLVVNGHNRLELLKRTGEEMAPVRFLDAKTAEEARARGALINIAEGRGTATDAAKYFRDRKATPADLANEGVSLRGDMAREGLALSKLAPDLFDQVATAKVPQGWGVAIGSLLDDPVLQREAMKAAQGSGKRLTTAEVTEVARQVRDAGTEAINQESLFGTETERHGLFVQKAQLAAAIKKQLAGDRRLFGFVAKGARPEQLGRAGTTRIDVGAAREIAQGSAQAEEMFDRLSTRTGPLGDILTAGARRIARGEKPAAVVADLYPTIREAVSQEITRGGAGVPAGRAGGPLVPEARPPAPEARPPEAAPVQGGPPPAVAPTRHPQTIPTIDEGSVIPAEVQRRIGDVSRPREERQRVIDDRRAEQEARRIRYKDQRTVKEFVDAAIAEGYDSIKHRGAQVYLIKSATGDEYPLKSQAERDYAKVALRYRAPPSVGEPAERPYEGKRWAQLKPEEQPERIRVNSGSGYAGKNMSLTAPGSVWRGVWLIDEMDVEQWAAKRGYDVVYDPRSAGEKYRNIIALEKKRPPEGPSLLAPSEPPYGKPEGPPPADPVAEAARQIARAVTEALEAGKPKPAAEKPPEPPPEPPDQSVREDLIAAFGSEAQARAVAEQLELALGPDLVIREPTRLDEVPKPYERLTAVRGKGGALHVNFRGQPGGDPETLFKLLHVARDPKNEHFHTLLLGDGPEILSHVHTSSGALGMAELGKDWMWDTMDRAKRVGATRVAMVHNHPSGNPTPSKEDRDITQQMALELYAQGGPAVTGHLVTDDETAVWMEVTVRRPRAANSGAVHDEILKAFRETTTPTRRALLLEQLRSWTEITLTERTIKVPRAKTAPPDWTTRIGPTVLPKRAQFLPEDLARFLQDTKLGPNWFGVLHFGPQANTLALEPHRISALQTAGTWLQQKMRAYGTAYTFIVVDDPTQARYHKALAAFTDLPEVTDVINLQGVQPGRPRSAWREGRPMPPHTYGKFPRQVQGEPRSPYPALPEPGGPEPVETVEHGRHGLTRDKYAVHHDGYPVGPWADTPELARSEYAENKRLGQQRASDERAHAEAVEQLKAGADPTDKMLGALGAIRGSFTTGRAEGIARELGLTSTEARKMIHGLMQTYESARGTVYYDAREVIAKARKRVARQTVALTPDPELGEPSLFGERAGTAASRSLAQTEAQARSDLPKLRAEFAATKDPAAKTRLARRIAELEKLVNRGQRLTPGELGTQAAAEPPPAPEEPGQLRLLEPTESPYEPTEPPEDGPIGSAAEELDDIPLPEAAGRLARESFSFPKALRSLRAIFNPESFGPQAKGTAGTIRAGRAVGAQELARAQEEVRALAKLVGKLDKRQSVQLWDAGERWGEPGTRATFQRLGIPPAMQDALEATTEDYTAELVRLEILEGTIAHYIGRYWVGPVDKLQGLLGRIFGKRPLEGPKTFKKRRTHVYFVDGLKAGLKPLTYNYVESQLFKLAEMQRAIDGRRMVLEEVEAGRAKKILMGQEIPTDSDGEWVRIGDGKDPAFTVYGPPTVSKGRGEEKVTLPVFGRRILGHFYAPAPSAAIWNNALSRPLRGHPIYDALMAPGQAAAQVILGLSGFHGIVIGQEAMISEAAFGRLAHYPTAAVHGVVMGRRIFEEYRKKGTHPELARVLDAMIQGGFGGKRESELWTGERWGRFQAALRDAFHGETATRKVWGATRIPLDAVWAAIEQLSRPLMGYYVPFHKAYATYIAVERALAKLPAGTDIAELRRVMGDIVKEMDYRFGQVQYDNHFIDNTAKNLAQLVFLAPGWTFGTLQLAARGVRQAGRLGRQAFGGAKGEPPIGTASLRYWVAAFASLAILNAILTKLLTGENPEGKDLLAFRDGTKDPAGNDNRYRLPGYIPHDLYAWSHHPARTLGNKLSPGLHWAFALATNRTYFGDKVYDEEADWPTTLKQIAEFSVTSSQPISFQNIAEAKRRGETGVLGTLPGLLGIGPMPREFERTPAQNLMAEILRDRGRPALTPEARATREAHGELLDKFRRGEMSYRDLRSQGVTAAQITAALQRDRTPYLVGQFKRLSLDEAEKVYAKGTPEEQAAWHLTLIRKRSPGGSYGPPRRPVAPGPPRR